MARESFSISLECTTALPLREDDSNISPLTSSHENIREGTRALKIPASLCANFEFDSVLKRAFMPLKVKLRDTDGGERFFRLLLFVFFFLVFVSFMRSRKDFSYEFNPE